MGLLGHAPGILSFPTFTSPMLLLRWKEETFGAGARSECTPDAIVWTFLFYLLENLVLWWCVFEPTPCIWDHYVFCFVVHTSSLCLLFLWRLFHTPCLVCRRCRFVVREAKVWYIFRRLYKQLCFARRQSAVASSVTVAPHQAFRRSPSESTCQPPQHPSRKQC